MLQENFNAFLDKSLSSILLLLKHKFVKLAWRFSNLYNASSQKNNQIKLTYYDETKKMVIDSQIVRANENLNLSHG